MPKGRMLNKRICKDIIVSELSIYSALLYTWCIPHLDVEGRVEANSEILKGIIFPYRKDFTLKKIEDCLEELSKTNLVILYGDNHKYLEFKGFKNNQKINKDREAPSEIPTPEELQSNSRVTPAKVNISKVNIKQEEKTKYLDFVLLTLKEYQSLKDKLGDKADIWVKKLNDYIGSKGNKYKSHYHTICMWVDKEKSTTIIKGFKKP